jgi:hypothetical protein
MTTEIQCQAHPVCAVPAPSETGICHCHAKQADKPDPRSASPAWPNKSGGP